MTNVIQEIYRIASQNADDPAGAFRRMMDIPEVRAEYEYQINQQKEAEAKRQEMVQALSAQYQQRMAPGAFGDLADAQKRNAARSIATQSSLAQRGVYNPALARANRFQQARSSAQLDAMRGLQEEQYRRAAEQDYLSGLGASRDLASKQAMAAQQGFNTLLGNYQNYSGQALKGGMAGLTGAQDARSIELGGQAVADRQRQLDSQYNQQLFDQTMEGVGTVITAGAGQAPGAIFGGGR